MHLKGFGKFVDTRFYFQEGFNLVFGKNEAGKSTLQSFIKAMLFGLDRNTLDTEDRPSDSRKYNPWASDEFGGSMEILLSKGETLRLEQDFTNRQTNVYDDNLRNITSSYPYSTRGGLRFGETILGMDRECFENSAFIRQGGTVVLKNERKNLIERLMNLSQTGSEDSSAADTLRALGEAKKSLGNDRTQNRPYNMAKKDLANLENALEKARKKHAGMAGHLERKSYLEDKLAELKKKVDEANMAETARDLFKQRSQLLLALEQQLESNKEIDALSREIYDLQTKISDYGLPSGVAESDIMSHIRKAAASREKLNMVGGIDPEIESVKLAGLKKRRGILKILCYIGITVSAAAAFIFHPLIFTATGLLTLLLAFLYFKKPSHTQAELDEKIRIKNDCSRELIMINAFIESAGGKHADSFGEAELTLNSLFEKLNSISRLRNLIEIKDARKSDAGKARNALEVRFGPVSIIEQQLENLDKKIESAGFEESALPSSSDSEHYRTSYAELERELAGINFYLRESLHGNDSPAEEEEALAQCSERLKNIEAEKRAIELAENAVAESALELQKSILPKISGEMESLLEKITGGTHANLRVGSDMTVNSIDLANVRSIWDFSDGTVDQMYFSLRVAAARAFSEKEPVPLIIDEPFAFYDEERIRNAFELLSRLSGDLQIILFTCKEKELELASGLNDINIIRI